MTLRESQTEKMIGGIVDRKLVLRLRPNTAVQGHMAALASRRRKWSRVSVNVTTLKVTLQMVTFGLRGII